MVKDLRHDTVKLLEESIEKTSSDINYSNTFLDQSLDKNKQDSKRLTSFCIAKKTINKMKRQSLEWEKTCKYLIWHNIFFKKNNQKRGRRPNY